MNLVAAKFTDLESVSQLKPKIYELHIDENP